MVIFFQSYLKVSNQTIRLINEQDVINNKQVYEGSLENLINEHAIDLYEKEFMKKIIKQSFSSYNSFSKNLIFLNWGHRYLQIMNERHFKLQEVIQKFVQKRPKNRMMQHIYQVD